MEATDNPAVNASAAPTLMLPCSSGVAGLALEGAVTIFKATLDTETLPEEETFTPADTVARGEELPVELLVELTPTDTVGPPEEATGLNLAGEATIDNDCAMLVGSTRYKYTGA
jgi:hypothetical protein